MIYESLAYLASIIDFVYFLRHPAVSPHLQLLIKDIKFLTHKINWI